MHKYLRAVGFSEFEKKSQIDEFFKENLDDTNLVSTYIGSDMRICGQYNIPICQGAGIAVIGEQEKDKLALIDFYFPYLKGYDYTSTIECTIERHSDKDSFAGIIDDYKMGIALIFYLTNGNVYSSLLKTRNLKDIKINKVFLSALSLSGRIILPIEKKTIICDEFSDVNNLETNENLENDVEENEDEFEDDDVNEEIDNDDNEIETRLIDEIDGLSNGGKKSISIGIGIKFPKNPVGEQEERLKSEDLYSIVETSLIPYGIEADKYQIVAEILSVNKKTNSFTGEQLIEMRVDTMGIQFNLMINEKDLDGEPLPGRRFRGVVWLIGEVEFLTKEENKEQKDQEQ